jgi:hypothetical protein
MRAEQAQGAQEAAAAMRGGARSALREAADQRTRCEQMRVENNELRARIRVRHAQRFRDRS